jgi:plastocyanin
VRRVTLVAMGAAAAVGAGGFAAAHATGSAAATKRVKADPGGGLSFTKERLRAAPGRVTIVMKNPRRSGKPHAVSIEGNGVDKDGNVVQPGGKSRVTARLGAGRYTFSCPVDGHEAAGMKGTLIVG